MSRPAILALDPDGILVDGMGEDRSSAWQRSGAQSTDHALPIQAEAPEARFPCHPEIPHCGPPHLARG